MSLVVHRFIYCDDCGENNGGDDREKSANQIRVGRKSEGWKVGPPKDYCPDCLKKKQVIPLNKEAR